MKKVVEIVDLKKSFGEKKVLKGVSLCIKQGMVYGLLGPNGAGKTTIIKIICGVYRPTFGTAFVAGIDVSKKPEQVRMKLGYMSQKFTLYEDLTVNENISFYSNIYGLNKALRRKRVEELTKLVELVDRGEQIVKFLSGGWKQRLALVCALLHSPPILILDEPTAGVDPMSRKLFWKIIRKLSQDGLSVLVTTHYMDEAEMCDEVGIIYDGLLVAEGSPERLMKTYNLRTLAGVFEKSIIDYDEKQAQAIKQESIKKRGRK